MALQKAPVLLENSQNHFDKKKSAFERFRKAVRLVIIILRMLSHDQNFVRPRKGVPWISAHSTASPIISQNKYNDDYKRSWNTTLPMEAFYNKSVNSKSPKKRTFCGRFNNAGIPNIIIEYCNKTSLHGLRYTGDKDISIFERLFWIIAFIGSVMLAAFYIKNIYDKWQTSPIIVSLNPKYIHLDEIPFPAVTVCNMNQAQKIAAQKIQNDGSDIEKSFLDDLCNHVNESVANNSAQLDTETSKWENVQKFMIKVAQSCNEMLHVCQWRDEVENCEDMFNTVLTDDGLCCSFNRVKRDFLFWDPRNLDDLNITFPLNPADWTPENGFGDAPVNSTPRRPPGSGRHLGLTLVINADIDDYYCSSTSSSGFKMRLHSPIETPKMADYAFFIAPGRETRIVVQPTISDADNNIRNIPVDQRQCFFAHERTLRFFRTYTQRNCEQECEANLTLAECKCVPYYMPKSKDTKICSKNGERCVAFVKGKFDIQSATSKKCECFPGCFEVGYEKEQSNSVFNDLIKVRTDYLKGFSTDYFKKNFAIIHIYFTANQFTKFTKGELFGSTEFLSNTGGLLGLFMGFSFLSAIEVVYFFSLKLFCAYLRNKNQVNKNNIYPFAR